MHNYDETFCTLLLATRARVVKNHAHINERIEREQNAAPQRQALLAQMRQLQSEVARLRKEKAERTVPRPLRSSSNPNQPSSPSRQLPQPTPPPFHHHHVPPYEHHAPPSAPLPPPPWASLTPAQQQVAATMQAAQQQQQALAEQQQRAWTQGHLSGEWAHGAPPECAGGYPQETYGVGAQYGACAHYGASVAPPPPDSMYTPTANGVAMPPASANATPYDVLRARVANLFADGAPLPGGSAVLGGAAATWEESMEQSRQVLEHSGRVLGAAESAASSAASAALPPMPPMPPMPGASPMGAPAPSPAPYANGHGPTMTAAAPAGSVWEQVVWSETLERAAIDAARASAASLGGVPSQPPHAGALSVGPTPLPARGSSAALQARMRAGLPSGANGAEAAEAAAAALADDLAHPSPSELPLPSQLKHVPSASHLGAAAEMRADAHLSGLNSLIGAAAEGAPSLVGSEGEGDVVLDQLVSGLLATPCIRRRLDQLYGRAPPSQFVSQPASPNQLRSSVLLPQQTPL